MPIPETLNRFSPITLSDMDQVKLMNRIDTKYVLDSNILVKILQSVSEDYFILEMDKKRQFPYQSLYYDTDQDFMYTAHHNGKLNRFKIRFRKYISSNDTFLEIKQKVKGVRTLKNRVLVNTIQSSLEETSKEFIKMFTPFDPDSLESKIYTDFSRITLVGKKLNERVTIDNNLQFYFKGNEKHELKKCTIIELKRDGAINSKLAQTLKDYGIYPSGMSKYCLGRALTEKKIKKNNFKRKILTLNKIEHGKFYYRIT